MLPPAQFSWSLQLLSPSSHSWTRGPFCGGTEGAGAWRQNGGVPAAIPYTTFPVIEIGPVTVRTFGVMVAIGVALGTWLAARWGRRFGMPVEYTYGLATRMVIAGVVGARLTWVVSHLDQIDTPLDVVATWKGGLQFSGGFTAAVVIGYPLLRRLPPPARWHVLDGCAYGLTIGLAVGRIGCYAVGEHFGRPTSFPLAVRYEGGTVREAALGDLPLRAGTVFHHTALYELLVLVALFGVLSLLRRRAVGRPGLLVGAFCVAYGVARFLIDGLRVNDERVLGLTGAQYLAIVTAVAGVWILLVVRRCGASRTEAPRQERPRPAATGSVDA